VDVRAEWATRRLERPFEERIFDVWAHHLENDSMIREKPMTFAPGVVLKEGASGDLYTGTALALIQAGVIEEHQLPGMPGCGKCTTTFDSDGKILQRGSTDWCQAGFKVVRKYGKKFSVNCIVTDEEKARRVALYQQKWDAYEMACLQAKRDAQTRQSAPRQRPDLRLVWSV
jgi:hypothetical protein